MPRYKSCDAIDIRDERGDRRAYSRKYGSDIALVVHTAAQPSHDWAAREPLTDFTVNANGTLIAAGGRAPALPGGRVHLHVDQQGVRRHAQPPAAGRAGDALGNRPVAPLRTSTASTSRCRSTSASTRLFGASKVAADVLVQEYGRYFGMKTGVLPRRLPDRPRPLGHGTARLPLLPDEVRA